MDLPTYTNIWRIEKRLYKLYDLRLPMPLPIVWIGVFVGVFVPWSLLLVLVGVPVEMPWHVLFLVPPGIVTWLSTRPVIEGKRLTELLESQLRYLGQPKAWYRMAPSAEPEAVMFSGRVWRTAPVRAKSKGPRKARHPQRKREGQRIIGPRQVRPAVAAAAAAAATAPVAEPTGTTRWGTRRGTAPALKAQLRQTATAAGSGTAVGAGRREEALSGGSGRSQDALLVPVRETGFEGGTPDEREPAVRERRSGERRSGERRSSERESGGRDSGTRVSGARESGARDSGGRDSGGRDSGGRGVADRQGADRQGAGRDGGRPEVGREELERQDVGRGVAERDRAGREVVGREVAGREAVEQEVAGRNGAGREAAGRGVAGRGAAGREAGEREVAAGAQGGVEFEGTRGSHGEVSAEALAARGAVVPIKTVESRKPAAGKPIDTEALRRLRRLAASADAPAETVERVASERREGNRHEDEVARDQHRKGQPPRIGPTLVLSGTPQVWPPLNPNAKPLPRPSARKDVQRDVRDEAPDVRAETQGMTTDDIAQRPGRAGADVGAAEGTSGQESTGLHEVTALHRAAETNARNGRATDDDRPTTPTDRTEPPRTDRETATEDDRAGSPRADGESAAQPGRAESQSAAQDGHAGSPRTDRETAAQEDRAGSLRGEREADAQDGRVGSRRGDREAADRDGRVGASRGDREAVVEGGRAGVPRGDREVVARDECAGSPKGDRETDAPDRRVASGMGERAVPVDERPVEVDERRVPVAGERGAPVARERAPEVAEVPEVPEVAGESFVPVAEERVVPVPVPRPGEGRVRRVESVVGRDSGGWRRIAQVVVGGGGVRTDGSEIDEARARAVFGGCRRVVVLGCTGGAGQSTTALMLGHTFAKYRDDRVVAVDANTGGSTLTSKIQPETPETLTSLLAGLDRVSGYLTMRGYTTRTASGLEVVSADTDAGAEQRLADRSLFSDHRLGESLRLLDRHYKLAVIDPAAALAARLLPYADQLVLVVPASEEASEAVAMTYEWLDGHGCAELRRRAVMVVNGVSRRSMTDVEQAESVARGRCRAIVRVPWEDDLAPDGAEVVDPGQLRAAGRRAYLALAGVVVAGFAAQTVRPSEEELASDPPGTRIGER